MAKQPRILVGQVAAITGAARGGLAGRLLARHALLAPALLLLGTARHRRSRSLGHAPAA